MSGVPFDDSLSETSSVADEERVRKLFLACDYNGDGFIDSSDLEMVCQELELGECVQELLTELGADRSGKVSYNDFLSRRKALRREIDALKVADTGHSGGSSSQDLPGTASNSFSKQELWEWDSGARDLSPELHIPPPSVAPPDAMAELASTISEEGCPAGPPSRVAGQQACEVPGDAAPLGPSVYYYGDLARNREKREDDLPQTHRPLRSPKGRRDKVVTLDRKKRKQKFRRRTNTFDGEIQNNRTKVERNGNSDGDTDYLDNDFDDFDGVVKDNFCDGFQPKSGEDLPLLGKCPVALADRSRAYLCKNLDLEADDVSLKYDEPHAARKSVTYSNAGTFPMPDGKRGHYDEPEAGGQQQHHHEHDEWNAGVTRSRSWYLCCPGAGGSALQTAGGNPAHEEEALRTTPVPVTSAPSPGENQYLHLAAVSSLKNEVLELSARLHAAHRDRDAARDALCIAQTECGRLRSALTAQARASEERLTELHGVIAELRRAGAARDRAAIPELREDESELETSCREGSITGGNGSDRTTSPGDADETASIHQDQDTQSPISPAALPIPDFPNRTTTTPELYFKESQYRSPGEKISSSEIKISSRTPLHAAPDSTSFEEDTLEMDKRVSNDRRRRRATSRSPRPVKRDLSAGHRSMDAKRENEDVSNRDDIGDGDVEDEVDIDEPRRLADYSPRLGNRLDARFGQLGIRGSPVSSASPQTKLASRVRLRRTHEDSRLTGKDICQEGVYSSAVAEHLARSALYENETEDISRLIARVDRLEADNVLLSATLRESKEHADRLSLACAQCSAEAGALRVALAAADRAVEAYDVLLALAETNQIRGNQMNNNIKLRAAAERVAKQLLARLEDEAAGLLQPEAAPGPGPWSDPAAMLLYHNSSNIGSGSWNQEEEERLRNHVSRLKRERTMTACGAQPAAWPLQDENDGAEDSLPGNGCSGDKLKYLDPVDARKLDMETAVLMQEVMSLREERAELRARLRSFRPPTSRQTNSSSGIDDGDSEWRLLEALARENSLKIRLQKLMASVQQAGKVGDFNEDIGKICPKCGSRDRSIGDAGENEIALKNDNTEEP